MEQEQNQVQNQEQREQSPDLKAALDKQAIAEANSKIAEAQKIEAENRKELASMYLPSSDTKGLEGTVTVNKGAGYFAEIMAYDAMEDCVEEIAIKLKTKLEKIRGTKTLIILGKVVSAEEMTLWNLLKIKLDNLTTTIDDFIPKLDSAKIQQGTDETGEQRVFSGFAAASAILNAAPAILGTVADIASFFKINRTISSRSVAINEQALISTIAQKIKMDMDSITIILPELNLTSDGKLISGITKLITKRSQLLEIKNNLISQREEKYGIDYIEALTSLKMQRSVIIKVLHKMINDNDGNGINKYKRKLVKIEIEIEKTRMPYRDLSKVITRLDKIITAVDELIATFTDKTDNNLSLLERVITMEQINTNTDAIILRIFITSQGGEIETSQTKFTQGRVSYLGGSIISYFLAKNDGECLFSGNEQMVQTGTFKRRKGNKGLKKARQNVIERKNERGFILKIFNWACGKNYQ